MIVATRSLTLRTSSGDVEVPVRIFAPRQDGTAWACDVEIGWPDEPSRSAAFGFDAVQALHLAFEMIGIKIHTSEHHEAGDLRWVEQGRGHGFPVGRTVRDLLIGDDAVYFGEGLAPQEISMELHIIARFHARVGEEGAVAAALHEVSGPTRAEPGCTGYNVFRSTRDAGLFFIHSRWVDEAAFETHAELPHTVHFLATVGPLIDHALDVTRATVMI